MRKLILSLEEYEYVLGVQALSELGNIHNATGFRVVPLSEFCQVIPNDVLKTVKTNTLEVMMKRSWSNLSKEGVSAR